MLQKKVQLFPITICLFRRRTTDHRKETHQSTMETTSSIRDFPSPGTSDRKNNLNRRSHAANKKLSTTWHPERTVDAQVPRYVTPSDAKANTQMRHATSMDHLRRIRDHSPEETEKLIDGAQACEPLKLDNTTISRSIEYRRPPPEHFTTNKTPSDGRTGRMRHQHGEQNTSQNRKNLRIAFDFLFKI